MGRGLQQHPAIGPAEWIDLGENPVEMHPFPVDTLGHDTRARLQLQSTKHAGRGMPENWTSSRTDIFACLLHDCRVRGRLQGVMLLEIAIMVHQGCGHYFSWQVAAFFHLRIPTSTKSRPVQWRKNLARLSHGKPRERRRRTKTVKSCITLNEKVRSRCIQRCLEMRKPGTVGKPGIARSAAPAKLPRRWPADMEMHGILILLLTARGDVRMQRANRVIP